MSTKKEWKPAQAFEEGDAPTINMAEVESGQVARIGYDATTRDLAVQFKHGAKAIYVHPGVAPELHAEFMAAESKGTFYGERVKPLPFKKYRAPAGDGLTKQPATA